MRPLDRVDWRLGAILIAATAFRGVLCYGGGQFYSGDESMHFYPGLAAAGALIGGDPVTMAHELLYEQHHAGFRIWSFLVSLAGFAIVGQAVYPQIWLVAWMLSLASVGVIALTYGLARRTGAGSDEAVLAAALAASATSLAMYARYLLPYDTGLALDLLALWIGLRPGRWRRAFVVGFVAGLGFLTYYAYLAVALVAVAVHAFRGDRSLARFAARVAALGAGWLIPFAAFEIASLTFGPRFVPELAPYHEALWDRLHGAPESWGSTYAEGWSVPWEYLWHAEHLVLVAWLALIVIGWRRPRVRFWGLVGLALYGWFALHSTVLNEAVVLGRFARQIVPFLCLAAAAGFAALRVPVAPRRVGCALYALMVAINVAPLLAQRFPSDVGRMWVDRFGPLAYDVTIEGPHGNPGDPASRYLALNVEPNLMTWPVDGLRDVQIEGKLIESYPHPLAWRASQYEGYTPQGRAALRSRPYRMELWERASGSGG